MKRTFPLAVVLLALFFADNLVAQSTFSFNNRPGGPVDAPVYDWQGVPLSGPNYVAELYGGVSSASLIPTTDLFSRMRFTPAFRTGTNAGYWFGNNAIMTVWEAIPGGAAWLQVRAWDVRLGATYEDVVALGLGGYGESPLFYARGGDPTQYVDPAPLIGLESFSLRPIIPEPSAPVLFALGSVVMWMLRQRHHACNRDIRS